MKAIVVDVSRNSSYQKVMSFLSHHNDAQIIYTFDNLYCKYDSIEELLSDLEDLSDTFFVSACAYYDMTTSILGLLRKEPVDSIIVYSPQIDECSRLSSEWLYDNYIRHFNTYSGTRLDINFSGMLYNFNPKASPFKTFFNRFSLKNFINMISFHEDNDEYYEPDDDFYSAG